MKAEIDLYGTDVELVFNKENGNFIVRATEVLQTASGPKRGTRKIHLTLTPKQAALLWQHLGSAGPLLKDHLPGTPTLAIDVPPDRERH